jgi:copper resistance protein C
MLLPARIEDILAGKEIVMKILALAGLVAATLGSGAASAHTHLKSSVPADGSTVTATPAVFVLNFTEAARLTALSIQKSGSKAEKIDALPRAAAAQLQIAAPHLVNGSYTLAWRVVGNDGHVMDGKISFSVGGKPAPGAKANDTHGDHAEHGH